MRQDYQKWLAERKYSDGTQASQLYRVKKVEEHYGSLDERFVNGSYQDVINSLEYSTKDEHANKPNPSKIKFDGNIRNNLQSYKNAVVRYQKFLLDSRAIGQSATPDQEMKSDDEASTEDSSPQKFSLERDMQAALRKNISSLEPSLKIIDDGAERAVGSGFIDITCEDGNGLVVVELKAGKADSRAIGQILGYMGDLYEEEGGKPVRGILVAHDFDKRTKSAARVVPALVLKRYSIKFTFMDES